MALPQTLLSLIFILGAISLMNLCWHWKTRQLACPRLVEIFRLKKKKSNGYATSTALTRRQGDFDQGLRCSFLGGGAGPAGLNPNGNLSIGH